MVNQAQEIELPLEQAMSDERDDSPEGSSDFSNESQFSVNTVVTRIESRPFKGIPQEWHEPIQVKHNVT